MVLMAKKIKVLEELDELNSRKDDMLINKDLQYRDLGVKINHAINGGLIYW